MTSLQEKLGRLYSEPEKKAADKNSWIPKRMSNDPLVQFKKTHQPEKELSQVRTQEILHDQVKPAEIFDMVRQMLEIKLHKDDIEEQLKNFHESYNKYLEKYQELLIEAIDEFVNEGTDFLHFTGHIDKDKLKDKVKEILKRKKMQKKH